MFKPQAKANDIFNGVTRYGYYRECIYGEKQDKIQAKIQGDGVDDRSFIVDPNTVQFASGADIKGKMVYEMDRLASKIDNSLENSYEVYFCRRSLQWMAKPYLNEWSNIPLHSLLKQNDNIEFMEEEICLRK